MPKGHEGCKGDCALQKEARGGAGSHLVLKAQGCSPVELIVGDHACDGEFPGKIMMLNFPFSGGRAVKGGRDQRRYGHAPWRADRKLLQVGHTQQIEWLFLEVPSDCSQTYHSSHIFPGAANRIMATPSAQWRLARRSS